MPVIHLLEAGMNDPRTWFRPKRFGFGYAPATREGWLVTGVLVLLAGLAARGLR
jgi:hypothetical protein